MSRGPIWIDTDVLINIERGTDMHAEAALLGLRGDGYELLMTPWGANEFLHGGSSTPQKAMDMQKILDRLGVKMDTTVPSVSTEQMQRWREQAASNISAEDRISIVQIKASATTRGI